MAEIVAVRNDYIRTTRILSKFNNLIVPGECSDYALGNSS